MRDITGLILGLTFFIGGTCITHAMTFYTPNNGHSCGSWAVEHRVPSPVSAQLDAWALGVLTGWAQTLADMPNASPIESDILKGTDHAAALEWLNKYCADHPLDETIAAIAELAKEIRRRRSN
jgi:hypothetical protein